MATKTLSRLAALCAVPLLLSACTRPILWDTPSGVSSAQFHRDNVECQQTARATVGDGFVMGPPLFVALASAAHNDNMRAVYKECMMGKDYAEHQK